MLGREAYGAGVAVIALPLVIQGVLESMVNAAAIAGRGYASPWGVLRRSWIHLAIIATIGGALSTFYLPAIPLSPFQRLILGAFFSGLFCNTLARSIAFAERRYWTLVAHYWAAFMGTAVSLPLTRPWGLTGFLAMMTLVQLLVLLALLLDPGLRTSCRRALSSSQPEPQDFPFLITYGAALSSKASQIALGPLALFVGSFQWPPCVLAEFRVCQALSGSLAYLVPAHPILLQAEVAASGIGVESRGPASPSRAVLLSLGLFFAVALPVTLLLWILYPRVIDLLGASVPGTVRFRTMVLCSPFYVAVPLLSGVHLGCRIGVGTILIHSTSALIAVGAAVLLGADAGFCAGSIVCSTVLGIASYSSLTNRKRENGGGQ